MSKKMQYVIIGIMCFILTIGIVVQIKTVNNNGTTVGVKQEESELKTQVLKMKEKYENSYEKLQKTESELEKTRENATNNNEELNKLGQIQVISREEGSGTRDTFASLAGFNNKDGADGIDKTVNTATIADSMDSVIETVNKNPSAIGYVSAGTTGIEGVKTLEINGEAVSDNKGKYPLTRSFYLAYS